MAVNNNLFPPIIDSYMPAFLITEPCKIYFSLSEFNSLEDIKNAQVTVSSQLTNTSLLSPDLYPSQVKIVPIETDTERTTTDRYFVKISSEDIKGGFQINQYYKVQIRFTGKNAQDPPEDKKGIDTWLTDNLNFFSEWSTVCLIRAISSPTLKLNGFNSDPNSITHLESSHVDILGVLTFADAAESETLNNYQLRLYDSNNTLLTDSGLLYSDRYSNPNGLNYTLKYGLIEGNEYRLDVEYTTQNLYTQIVPFKFLVIQSYTDKLEADLKYVIDENNACIGINIKSKESVATLSGNITIRRTSSESNFTIWEDVHTFSIPKENYLNYTWYDYTIESGIWYKYCAQKRSNEGQRGIIVQLNEPRMMVFEDMFLTGQNRQLKIQFNPTVSSFKRNVLESNTTTIGGKYPYIRRNGDLYYRSFPIGGLISSEMDDDCVFTNKKELYQSDENVALYDNYNKENNVPYNYDFIYERKFREKVEEFLMENKVKLFRSPTEGNILVKLMDVNFTPNQTLGRRLWSFSATAYEIDAATVENYSKYGIQSLGKYQTQLEYPSFYFGQLQEPIPAGTNVLTILKQKYQQRAQVGYELNISDLDFLRLEIEDEPYLIKDTAAGPEIAEPDVRAITAAAADEVTYLGYLVYINDIPIVINPEGKYELSNEGTKITSVVFPIETSVLLDYNANVVQIASEGVGSTTPGGGGEEEPANKIVSTTFDSLVGQCWGGFSYKDSVIKQIWNKHYETYSDYSESLYYLNNVKIEADPGTVVYVKESRDTDFERHVIGPTCVLDFYSEKANVLDLYFTGIHFELANDYEILRDTVPDYKFKETGITLDETTLMRDYKLVRNGVYTLTDGFIQKHPEKIANLDQLEDRSLQVPKTNMLFQKRQTSFLSFMENRIVAASGRYIYYNNKFWLFTEENDLLCPVEALIDYYCDVIKERYK